MHILFLAGREIGYARNEVLLRALRRLGEVDVVAPPQTPASLWTASLRVVNGALPRLRKNQYDLVFVGFYGHLILRLLGRLIRPPILFDAFVSTYDTLCFDRQRFAPTSLPGRLTFWLDRSTCLLADRVLLDTQHHVDYFVQTFDLPAACFDAVPVGCSEAIFTPQPYQAQSTATQVLGYSTFLPLHGMETIVRAAALLRNQPLHFRLIGAGPLLAEMQGLAAELQLTHVTFAPPVSPTELAGAIAAADLCLGGHFGPTAKAGRVIPGKVYQMLAVGRAVVAGDTPANRELLHQGENAWLVSPADPAALAVALVTLHADPALRSHLAHGGRRLYERRGSEAVIGQQVQAIVEEMLTQGSG